MGQFNRQVASAVGTRFARFLVADDAVAERELLLARQAEVMSLLVHFNMFFTGSAVF